MSGTVVRVNSRSTEHTGNLVIPKNPNRTYFFIVFTAGTGTIEFGDGGGKIPLGTEYHYSPHIAPTSEISIETTGTFIIHMG